jgi:hypothetical protein
MNVRTLAVLALLAIAGCTEKAAETTETSADRLRACSTSGACARGDSCAFRKGAGGGRGACAEVPEIASRSTSRCAAATRAPAATRAWRPGRRSACATPARARTFTSRSIDAETLAAAPWESTDKLLSYSFATDGTFASSDLPACVNATPPC